jgi:hypothetical protein
VNRRADGVARHFDVLAERDPQQVDGYLKSSGRSAQSLGFLPLRAPHKDGAVLLDAASGEPLDILLIEPW